MRLVTRAEILIASIRERDLGLTGHLGFAHDSAAVASTMHRLMLSNDTSVTPLAKVITVRDGHCRNHGRLPSRDPI